MFSPAVPRSTSVVLAKNNAGQYCIVASLSTRPSTDVVFIDLGTGLLAKNKDKYTDEASALGKLRPQGYEVALQGCALLGYVAAGCTAGVLLATRVRKKCTLPGGHAVFLVVDSQWVLIPLQNGMSSDPTAAAQDLAFWTSMQQYTLNNAHYFCETADLSRPFPSTYAAQDPAPEFVWNSWLREPLRSLGLQELCPSLLQGAVECSQETHPSGQRYSIALLSRRSRRHPGTRYLARGLNSKAGPGNEIECELVVWTHPSHHEDAEEPLQWARVVWRRGTVPIWWGVNLQSLQKGLQAEVYVREKEPYKGTITYFRSLQRQHTLDSQVEAAINGDWTLVQGAGASNGQQQAGRGPQPQQRRQQGTPAVTDPSLQVPVTCVNLLHANPKKLSELMLSEHFHEAVRFVRKRVGGEMPVKVVNFDWHGNMGRLSEEKGIEGFWQFMDPVLRQSGLACGTMEPAEPSDREPQQEPNGRSSPGPLSSGTAVAAQEQQGGQGAFTAWPPHWRMRWRQQQNGIVRFNCADSLDRTNAATCFAMLPALEEGLRLLGIPLDCGGAAQQSPGSAALTKARIPSRSGTHSSSAQDLPGLVARADSEVLREAHPQGTYLGQLFQQELPPGWDLVNHQGRPLYVDHINKRTQWHPPTMPKPSSAKGFMQSAADMFKSLQRQSSPLRIGGGGPSPGHTRSSSFSNSFGSLGGDRGAGPSGAAGQFGSPDYPQSSHLLASPGAPSLLSGSPTKEPGLGAGAGASAGGSPGRGRGGSFAHLVAHATLPAAASPDLRGSFAHLVAHSSGARSSPDLRGEAAAGSVADVAAGSSDRPSTASEAYHSESPHIIDQEPDMVPWGFFSLGTVQEVRDRLYKDAVADYVEMFKVHGDIHSFLYTGSPAMHSHVLGLVVQGGKTYGASSGVGKLQNLRVAVQRRWNNTMSDASRQQAVELFLGLNIHKYYRGLELLYPVPQSEEQLLSQLDPADLLPTDDEHLHKSTELQHLPIQAHHGMLAVQQDLADLEPLDEDNDERAAAEAAGQLACEEGAEAGVGQGPGDSLSALQQQVQRPALQQEQHDPLAADLLSFGGPPAEHQLKQASGEAEAGGAARQQLRDLLL